MFLVEYFLYRSSLVKANRNFPSSWRNLSLSTNGSTSSSFSRGPPWFFSTRLYLQLIIFGQDISIGNSDTCLYQGCLLRIKLLLCSFHFVIQSSNLCVAKHPWSFGQQIVAISIVKISLLLLYQSFRLKVIAHAVTNGCKDSIVWIVFIQSNYLCSVTAFLSCLDHIKYIANEGNTFCYGYSVIKMETGFPIQFFLIFTQFCLNNTHLLPVVKKDRKLYFCLLNTP